MSENGKNFLNISRQLRIPLDPPPIRTKDREAWFIGRAREMIYYLSASAYLGIASFVNVDEKALNGVYKKPGIQTYDRKKLMDQTIEARVAAVDRLVPTSSDLHLGVLGLTGLGLLRSTCSDSFSIAARRLTSIVMLALHDPKGLQIYLQQPEIFDGNNCLSDDLRESNFSLLPPRAIHDIYLKLNSPSKHIKPV